MSGRGRWVALSVVVGCAGVATAVGWAAWPEDSPYRHSLVRYDGDHGEANRYVSLDDGAAQLSIGSPDDHRVVVQWRDPDGHGWTAPETVWTDRSNVLIDDTVRFGGGTVAIVETFTRDVHSEDDTDAVHATIVCRELTCTARGSTGSGSEPQVAPAGRTAYLGQDREAAYLWTPDRGIHRAPWSGHPGFDYHQVSPAEPVLAPDGSLRVVTSRPSRGHCTFELLASTPRTADLTSVARTTEPLRGRARSDCSSYNDTFSSDWLAVHPSDHRAPDFWFVRDGAAWSASDRDPSGLQLVDVDKGCCDTGIAGFIHWNDVAYGSPDGHQILVQSHLLGQETWSAPTRVAGAPAGYRCTWMDGHEVGDGYAVTMTCHSRKARNVWHGDAYAVAASPDLVHWEATFVTDVRDQPVVEDGVLRVGRTTWTPEGGFATS